MDAAWNTFAGECHGVQAGVTFQDDAVQGHLFTGFDKDYLTGSNFFRMNRFQLSATFHAGAVRADVYKVGDAAAAVALGLFFEPFSHLEEQHHKNGLRELAFSTGQKADAKGSQRSDAHQEVFVQGFAVDQGLGRLLQGVPTYNQVRDQEQQQVLPDAPGGILFDDNRHGEQHRRRNDFYQSALTLLLFAVVMVVVVPVFMLVLVFMFVFMLVFMFMFVLVLVLVFMFMTFAMVTRVMVMFMFFFSHNLSGFTSAKVQPLSCNPVANLAAHLCAVKKGQKCGLRCHFGPPHRQNRPKMTARRNGMTEKTVS